MITSDDKRYIRETFMLADSVRGRTSPDPLVGAVVVKNDEVIARGYHAEIGTPHAEAFAMQKAGDNAEGSTVYVSLEPCGHWGKNPPCVDLLIAAKVKRVVFSVWDPNPLVKNACGVDKLRQAGIEVFGGVLEEEGKRFNEAFIRHITTKMPFVYLKVGMSLDGKIATRTGKSKWITGPESMQFAHRLRRMVDAVIVGVETVLADEPRLTVRDQGAIKSPIKLNPDRVVLDSHGRIPLNSRIITQDATGSTIIAVTDQAPAKRIAELEKVAKVLVCAQDANRRVDWKDLLTKLGKDDIASVLIEGGGTVNASALEAKVVDKVYFIIAPKIIGGTKSPSPVGGQGIDALQDAIEIEHIERQVMDNDILVSGYIPKSTQEEWE